MRSESSALFIAEDIELARRVFARARCRSVAWRRRRLGLRGALLYIASAPLVIAAPIGLAFGDIAVALVCLAGFGLVAVSATLNRRGLLERLLAPERRYTSAIRLPLQHLAMLPLGLAVYLVANQVVGHGSLVSAGYGTLALIGFFLAYQPGPFRSWHPPPAVRVDDPALRRALQQAERQLLAIETAALNIGNAELEQRLRRIVDQGRTVLAMLAEQPIDLFRAQQFLAVHLDGAERVAMHYAKTHRLSLGGLLDSAFRGVLVQIEQAIIRQRRQLLEREAFDLDGRITALTEQLEHQGIR